MLDSLKPGVTLGELRDKCADVAAEIAPQSGPAAGVKDALNMHGRGQGDDGPIITGGSADPKQLAVPLREHMVFILKPQVRTADGKYVMGNCGNTVVVTNNGGLRVSARPYGIMYAEA